MQMERDCTSSRDRTGGDAEAVAIRHQTTSDFVLQWGNRKRLRCMKIQVKEKDDSSGAPVTRTTVRVDRRVVRPDKDLANQPSTTVNQTSNGYLNLRQRPLSPQQPLPQRILRNSVITSAAAMRGQSNGGGGGVRGITSPDRGAHDKKNHHHHHHHNEINHHNKSAASSDTAHDSKKGGTSSGSGEAAAGPPMVWPPKFVIALTNKEKEEDFMAIKGSKLPQRPKKRAKFIQRTLNLVSPGSWLCDLTLERYEVREKKISKKPHPDQQQKTRTQALSADPKARAATAATMAEANDG
ncbi:unnamed protein product [Malus baccata var. baccata]